MNDPVSLKEELALINAMWANICRTQQEAMALDRYCMDYKVILQARMDEIELKLETIK